MSPNQIDPELVQDTDGSSIDTAITPPETIPPDLTDDNDGPPSRASYPISYSIPEPGSTFIIRSVWSRNIITLLMGQVVLAPPEDNFGSPHWECIETNGCLGFRNIASGRFLGRNNQWLLCCSVNWHQEHEKFHIRSRPEGGYILLMTHWGKLRPVGMKDEKGEKKLAMVESGNTNGIVWEFVEVDTI
ncbi:uncharacterized protein BP5553_09397 [Venustampulla echinocandica]|uniref:Ricin B lectin domain-containing protein n=1 Tax=Venustampulla echinocandica TaxID=2656787 RepID=A0A370TCN9_9HELO|nr:uncharacterized protein BP5553_09397 [Venustampulla echinocandica]RDL31995.1 hypothetical protein BP5553_09397 [Venustampulla echinocandica]